MTFTEEVAKLYNEGVKSTEIAKRLGKPVTTIYNHVSNAKRKGLLKIPTHKQKSKMIEIPLEEPRKNKVVALFGTPEEIKEVLMGWVQNG